MFSRNGGCQFNSDPIWGSENVILPSLAKKSGKNAGKFGYLGRSSYKRCAATGPGCDWEVKVCGVSDASVAGGRMGLPSSYARSKHDTSEVDCILVWL